MSELVQPLFTPEGLRRVRVVSGPAGSGRTTRLKMLLVDARRAGLPVAGFLAERDARGRRKLTNVATGESRLLPAKPGPRREKALAFARKCLEGTDEKAVVFIDETASGGAADERTARAGWDLLASGKYHGAVVVMPDAGPRLPLPTPKPPETAQNAPKTAKTDPKPPKTRPNPANDPDFRPWVPRELWGQPTEIREIVPVPPPAEDVTKAYDAEAAAARETKARETWAETLWEAGVKDREAVAAARKLLARPGENAPETAEKGQKTPQNGQKTPETAPEEPKTAEKTQETPEIAPEGREIAPDFLPGGGADAKTVLQALELLKTDGGVRAKEALRAPDAVACLDSLGLAKRDILDPLPATKPPAPAEEGGETSSADPYDLPVPPGEPPRHFAS